MIEVEGLDDLEHALSRLAGEVSQDTLAYYGKRHMSTKVEKEAKILVRKRTRTLQRSITTQAVKTADGVEIRTGTNMEYARFLEYGTGRAGAESGIEPPADYQYGPSPGMGPKPYLRPAWDKEKNRVLSGLIEDLDEIVSRVAASRWDSGVYLLAQDAGGD
jgi:HK97 gp10 family phage protein